MPTSHQPLAVFDARPFFERALVYGVDHGIIDRTRIDSIVNDAPKGMVQIAEYFGTQYLRPNIEDARQRIVNLVSLFLEHSGGGDLAHAARSLRDNTFLSHSRGGSEMLKQLWALPEDSVLDGLGKPSQKAFLAQWSLRSLADYRKAQAQRQDYQATIDAARWFAGQLNVRADIAGAAAETVIRSALLALLTKSKAPMLPNGGDFLNLLAAIRKKGVPAKSLKHLHDRLDTAPAGCRRIALAVLSDMQTRDLPRILDTTRPINLLTPEIQPLYFVREFGPEDASQFDIAASAEWRKITGGKSDDASLLTVFVCLAADLPPKPSLSKAAARALIRKVRANGFQCPPVLAFLRESAPFQMRDDLETLWLEFFPEAETYLLDESDSTLNEALVYLNDNCVIV